MSPLQLCEILGIPVSFEPVIYKSLWDGEKLHISYGSEQVIDDHYRIRHLSDTEFFHDIAHVLLAGKYLKFPAYGFDMDPLSNWGIMDGTSPRQKDNQSQEEQDQEEYEADALGDILAFYCGVSQDCITGMIRDLERSDIVFNEKHPGLIGTPRMQRMQNAANSPRFWQVLNDFLEYMAIA